MAAAFGVVTKLLLSHKPTLHRWVGGLKGKELRAGIKLLLITVALLPVLPNKGYGPWGALNPYEIWWMVVLVAVISFVGYVAIKVGGARRGIIFTGVVGGLASVSYIHLTLPPNRAVLVVVSTVALKNTKHGSELRRGG